jgi:hypothetical protein
MRRARLITGRLVLGGPGRADPGLLDDVEGVEHAGDGRRRRPVGLKDRADQAIGRLSPALREVVDRAARHHTPTLAAGLAFFGLLSIGPAVSVGIGVVRLVAPDAAVDQIIEAVGDGYSETLNLGNLLEQMEDRAGEYIGLGLLVLLWPASTLASGWTRALDAINDFESSGVTGGMAGRLRGLGPGAVLVAGLLVLLSVVTVGSAFAAEQALLAVVLAGGRRRRHGWLRGRADPRGGPGGAVPTGAVHRDRHRPLAVRGERGPPPRRRVERRQTRRPDEKMRGAGCARPYRRRGAKPRPRAWPVSHPLPEHGGADRGQQVRIDRGLLEAGTVNWTRRSRSTTSPERRAHRTTPGRDRRGRELRARP